MQKLRNSFTGSTRTEIVLTDGRTDNVELELNCNAVNSWLNVSKVVKKVVKSCWKLLKSSKSLWKVVQRCKKLSEVVKVVKSCKKVGKIAKKWKFGDAYLSLSRAEIFKLKFFHGYGLHWGGRVLGILHLEAKIKPCRFSYPKITRFENGIILLKIYLNWPQNGWRWFFLA